MKAKFDHSQAHLFTAVNLTKIKIENRQNKLKKIIARKDLEPSEKIEEIFKLCKKDDELMVYLILFWQMRVLG
jgi:hypothetical protein